MNPNYTNDDTIRVQTNEHVCSDRIQTDVESDGQRSNKEELINSTTPSIVPDLSTPAWTAHTPPHPECPGTPLGSALVLFFFCLCESHDVYFLYYRLISL